MGSFGGGTNVLSEKKIEIKPWDRGITVKRYDGLKLFWGHNLVKKNNLITRWGGVNVALQIIVQGQFYFLLNFHFQGGG